MTVIYKYNITNVNGNDYYTLPGPKRVLSAGTDPQGRPCFWAEVDPDGQEDNVLVGVYGTGIPLPPGEWRYVNTFNDGPFMWHVYEYTGP
jgi:hypothetical protein